MPRTESSTDIATVTKGTVEIYQSGKTVGSTNIPNEQTLSSSAPVWPNVKLQLFHSAASVYLDVDSSHFHRQTNSNTFVVLGQNRTEVLEKYYICEIEGTSIHIISTQNFDFAIIKSIGILEQLHRNKCLPRGNI